MRCTGDGADDCRNKKGDFLMEVCVSCLEEIKVIGRWMMNGHPICQPCATLDECVGCGDPVFAPDYDMNGDPVCSSCEEYCHEEEWY